MEEDDFRLCDLPDEIVIHILDRLNSVARVRFAAVCRAWKLLLRRLLPLLAEPKELPWFITGGQDKKGHCIVLQQTCSRNNQLEACTKIKRTLKQELLDAIPPARAERSGFEHGTSSGWVVFYFMDQPRPALCLYSPFTEKLIYLPPGLPRCYKGLAMSHPPTCSDCVFFAFSDCWSEMCTYTWRPGDKNWTKHDLDIVFDMIRTAPTLESLMFLEGSFYCLFRSGHLLAFKVADKSWKLLTDSRPSEALYDFSCRYYELAECDGDIILVAYACLSQNCRCSAWKYEWAERSWRKINNLGGRVLFVNQGPCSKSMAVPAVGELQGLADRIYCSYDGHLQTYFSLRDGKFHCYNFSISYAYLYWITPPPLQV